MTRTETDKYQRESVERAMRLTPYQRSEIARLDAESAELQKKIDHNNALKSKYMNQPYAKLF